MNKNRNCGIELLRLVLMFMVCILHTLGRGGILANSLPNTINNSVFWAIEIFAFCAVDSFAIISGYVATDKPKKYERIVDIWFQVFFYSFIVTIILTLVGLNNTLGIKEIIKCALPITYNKFWYITAYFALFFAMPILNKFIFELDEKSSKKMFIIIVVLYSVVGIMADSFNSLNGYSAIWLMVLYCIGALAKKIKLFEKRSSLFLILIWIICIFITWFSNIYLGIDKLINYISPTILLSGIIMVVLFSRLKIKGNLLLKLSSLTLGIYLFQLNQVIWDNVLKGAFAFIAPKNILIGILYVILFSFSIFASGLMVEWIRQLISKKLKLHVLSEKIVRFVNRILEASFVFLK